MVLFEDNDSSRYINLTTSWIEDKYNMLNRELFGGMLGDCGFRIFTTGRGSHGKMLGLFTLDNKDLKCKRRNRRIFYHPYFDSHEVYVDKTNFFDICKPVIELNGNYKWTEKSALSTLLHEMCHYYTYMNGYAPSQGHGREFRSIAYIVSSKSNNTFPVERIASAEEMKEVELNQDIAQKNERRESTRAKNVVPLFIFFSNGKIGMIPAMNMTVANEIVKWNTTCKDVEKIVKSENDELKHYIIDKKYRLIKKYGVGYYPVQDNKEIMFMLNDGEYDVVYTKADTNESIYSKSLIQNKHKIMKNKINEVLDPVIPINEVYDVIINSISEIKQKGKKRITFREGPNGTILVLFDGRYAVVNWFGESKHVNVEDCVDNDELLAKRILLGIASILSKKQREFTNENTSNVIKLKESDLRAIVRESVEMVLSNIV